MGLAVVDSTDNNRAGNPQANPAQSDSITRLAGFGKALTRDAFLDNQPDPSLVLYAPVGTIG